MKCIRCGEDSKKKDRSGRVCPKCARRFAFDPAEGDPFTDAAFKHALDVVGAEGTVRFHRLHVYYQLCRQLPSGGLAETVGNLADTVLGWFSKPAAKVSAVGLTASSFDTLWRMWVEAHGKPKGVVEATERAPRKRSAELEAELEAYSFDRAVITDQPLLVDVLVANRFHFENNCALLSVDGHPADAFDTVRKMLRNNPRLVVVAVHDASVAGCGLAMTGVGAGPVSRVGVLGDGGRGDEQAGGDDRKQVAHVFTPQNQAFRPMTKRVCSGSPPSARVKSAVPPSSRLHSTPT